MGYIIKVDNVATDVGWNSETLHYDICINMMQNKKFSVTTTSRNIFPLFDDILVILCQYLDIETLLKLCSTNTSRCPRVISESIVREITKFIMKRYSLYHDRVKWRMLDCRYVHNNHDKRLVMNQYKFLYASGYHVNATDTVTYVGEVIVLNIEPEKFLELYQTLDRGDFDLFIPLIRNYKQYFYQVYLLNITTKYTFRHFADLLLNLNEVRLLKKYADIILEDKIVTKNLRWNNSDDIVTIYGIDNAINMYGNIEIVIERSHNIENLSHVCSYINKHFDQEEDLGKHLDLVSEKLIKLLDHINDNKKFIMSFVRSFDTFKIHFKNKKYINKYLYRYVHEYLM